MSFFVCFDDAAANCGRLYTEYHHSDHFSADALNTLDHSLQQGWAAGLHAVLWADYEFGNRLVDQTQAEAGNLTLYWFAHCTILDNVSSWLSTQAMQHTEPAGLADIQNDTSAEAYYDAIDRIQAAIARGDTYQINYTTRLHAIAYGHPIKLYQRLRQPVPYAALAHLPTTNHSSSWTLCFSPERFLCIDSDGIATTEPMKGTAPVLKNDHNHQQAETLRSDSKNRAENVMIVDLLRNDLGKLARTGGVSVPKAFEVNQFGTVWQMTSRIEARLKPHTSMADILRATFPCGSITGAPKRMSMEIIRQIETSPRTLYTGSIGWIDANPNSSLGFTASLNVVIRTLSLTPQNDHFEVCYGVGSGIVADSDAVAEYEECRWKAAFLTRLQPEFGIFETIAVHRRHAPLLSAHLARLSSAAESLNLPLPNNLAESIQTALTALADDGHYRFKILLHSDGLSFDCVPLTPLPNADISVLIAPQPLPNADFLRRFKTTQRALCDHAWQTAEKQAAFDMLFFNQRGELLEGGRSNVFIKHNGRWLTPPLSADILPGVMRQAVLADPMRFLHTETITETPISKTMLAEAEAVVLTNALRGILPTTVKWPSENN